MSKTYPNENSVVDSISSSQDNIQLKKLRFHPYYYQARRGSLYIDNKRSNIKITKIEKADSELILTLIGKKSDQKVILKGFWEDVTFDYYSISHVHKWKISFPKK